MRAIDTWKRILISLIIIAFIVIFIGGWIFYEYRFQEAFWPCLGTTLENCMEALLFSPILSIQEIMMETEFWRGLTDIKKVFVTMYCIALIVAPLLNLLFVFSILDEFLHFFVGITWKKKRVLIVGYNERVRKILANEVHESKIYLWTENVLSTEEERDLFFRKITVKMNDFSLGDNQDKYPAQINKFNKFLRKKRITNVLLLDESDVRNMEYYMALSNCTICKEKTIHFFVLSNNFECRNALQDYFDEQLEEKSKDINTHMDLRIFNFQQMQAEVLFKRCPLYTGLIGSDNKNVHLLIIGAGRLAEHTLLHAMNQGVLTCDNSILIDVVDSDIKSIEDSLYKRLNHDYVIKGANEHEYEISGDMADGLLQIRFNETDIYGNGFGDLINQLQKEKNGGKYTYIAVCLPDADSNLHCILELNKTDIVRNSSVPLAVNMSHSDQIKIYLEKFQYCCEAYLRGKNEEYINLEQIINSDEEAKIREYNVMYNKIQNSCLYNTNLLIESIDFAEKEWNKMKYYKRQSNRALYYHQQVKQEVFKGYEEELNEFFKSKETEGQTELARVLSKHLVKVEHGQEVYPKLVQMAKTEHRRFNYFYASEGWKYTTHKNESKREHDCMCSWDKLKEKREDVLIYDLISSMIHMRGLSIIETGECERFSTDMK